MVEQRSSTPKFWEAIGILPPVWNRFLASLQRKSPVFGGTDKANAGATDFLGDITLGFPVASDADPGNHVASLTVACRTMPYLIRDPGGVDDTLFYLISINTFNQSGSHSSLGRARLRPDNCRRELHSHFATVPCRLIIYPFSSFHPLRLACFFSFLFLLTAPLLTT